MYACTAAGGSEADFNAMVSLFRKSDLHEEKDRIMRAGMCSFGEKELLRKSLDFAISDDVRSQDSVFLIGGVAANLQGRDMAWQFFKENREMLHERYKSGFLLSHLVSSVIERFLTEEKADMAVKFFEEHPMPGSERKVAQAVETIRLNCAWLARDGAAINKFLSNL